MLQYLINTTPGGPPVQDVQDVDHRSASGVALVHGRKTALVL